MQGKVPGREADLHRQLEQMRALLRSPTVAWLQLMSLSAEIAPVSQLHLCSATYPSRHGLHCISAQHTQRTHL